MCAPRLIALLSLLLTSRCSAYPNGAGQCLFDKASVGGSHLSGDPLTGTLDDGGFKVTMRQMEVIDNAVVTLGPYWMDYDITVTGSKPFKGISIVITDLFDTGSEILAEPDDNLQVAENCPDQVALTHINSVPKDSVQMQLDIKEEVVCQADITVGVENSNGVSEYYYSSFRFQMLDTYVPDFLDDCYKKLAQADADMNSVLDKREYYNLITALGQESKCYVPESSELTKKQDDAFETIACTICLRNGEDNTCCVNPSEVPVKGATDPEALSASELRNLKTVCHFTYVDIPPSCTSSPTSSASPPATTTLPASVSPPASTTVPASVSPPAGTTPPPVSVSPNAGGQCLFDEASVGGIRIPRNQLTGTLEEGGFNITIRQLEIVNGAVATLGPYRFDYDITVMGRTPFNEISIVITDLFNTGAEILAQPDSNLKSDDNCPDQLALTHVNTSPKDTAQVILDMDEEVVCQVDITVMAKNSNGASQYYYSNFRFQMLETFVPDFLDDCYKKLAQADADMDSVLDKREYYNLITALGQESKCYVPELAELTRTQEDTFETIACTICLRNGGDNTCCVNPSEVPVKGATDPGALSASELRNLKTVCQFTYVDIPPSCNKSPPVSTLSTSSP